MFCEAVQPDQFSKKKKKIQLDLLQTVVSEQPEAALSVVGAGMSRRRFGRADRQ